MTPAPKIDPLDAVHRTIDRALDNLESLQSDTGSWPGDYGGPMFLLPMYVGLAYSAKRLPTGMRAAKMIEYFYNCQRPDGSLGLHAEATQGSMFTSSLGYAALRMLGVDRGFQLFAELRQSFKHIETVGHVGKVVLAVEIGARAT